MAAQRWEREREKNLSLRWFSRSTANFPKCGILFISPGDQMLLALILFQSILSLAAFSRKAKSTYYACLRRSTVSLIGSNVRVFKGLFLWPAVLVVGRHGWSNGLRAYLHTLTAPKFHPYKKGGEFCNLHYPIGANLRELAYFAYFFFAYVFLC